MAASLRKDPGINGWVLNSPSQYPWTCWYRLRVNSNFSGGTPDGAPPGLYIYDTNPGDVIEDASLTYWILGNHSADSSSDSHVSWTSQSGHGSCWGSPTRVGTQVKPDGRTYTGYRWTYNCTINPANVIVGSDGVGRVWLQHFHVLTDWFEQSSSNCSNLTYWTERHITINGVIHTFQRRNGTLGPYTGSNARMAPLGGAVDTEALDSQIAALDEAIADLDAQIAEHEAQVAAAAMTSYSASSDQTEEAEGMDTTEAPTTQGEDASAELVRLEAERSRLEEQKTSFEADRTQIKEQSGVPQDLPATLT